ncbi:MAG: hypothetical protein JXB39_08690 [Deltaproteobacteria bacterium]|nr:hypothetical protein [Deltaproteobacteria bacterium]
MSRPPAEDLIRLRERLQPVEEGAADLPWARERPWRGETHTWLEGDLLVVDLHDLDVATSRKVLQVVEAEAPHLESGAVAFVTGRGRHSLGPGVLHEVMRRELALIRHRHGWGHVPSGSGRQVLLLDPARAPARVTGRLPWAFWAGVLVFVGLTTLAFPPLGIAFAVLVLAGILWARRVDREERR